MNPTVEDQIKLEEFYKTQAEEMFKKRMEDHRQKGNITSLAIGGGLKKIFVNTFSANVKAWIEKEIQPHRGVQKVYKDLLIDMLDAFGKDKAVLTFCAVTLENVVNMVMANNGMNAVSYIGTHIGKSLYYDAKLEAFLKEDGNNKQENRIQAGLDNRAGQLRKEMHIKKIMQKFEYDWTKYNTKAVLALGAILIDILVASTDLLEYVPYHRKGMQVVATERFLELYKENGDFFAKFMTDYVPTIIPPKQWENLNDGGYYGILASKVTFIRLNYMIGKTKIVKDYLRKLQEVDLSEIMGAVNKIQETPYRINTAMLFVVSQIIDKGGDMAGIEKLDPNPFPKKYPRENQTAFKKRIQIYNEEEIKRRSKALRAVKIFNYAKSFSTYENIYFPCNIDFRGRIYPISALNHQGDDLMKSLVNYSNPVACQTEDDIDLLAIQGCNLYGNDKIPLRERIAFIKENHEHIIKSQDSPFDYDWWLQADEPLQFLAFCYEWEKATTYLSIKGTIIGFKCSIPIAYDGTCSGLQHYSAMLHDEVGGSAVNLIDHDRPADIYQEVADKVLKIVKEDAQNGTTDEIKKEATGGGQNIKFGTRTLAQAWLAYGITRKVCKRPVMTLAYGSGQYGFQEQIYSDTTTQNKEFDRIEKPCAKYLAKIIWECVQTTVISATEGMKYLRALASELVKHGLPVNWWTPLGLPVQQQYLKMIQMSFRTRFGERMSMPLYYQQVDPNETLDLNAQKNGIAPNFIHSLDSTHLMMVVNEAELTNYTTIHDSFGTSLGEARRLQKVIREQLHKLYTEHKPLEQFKEYVEEQIGEPVDIELPRLGNLDLDNILTSTFVFH